MRACTWARPLLLVALGSSGAVAREPSAEELDGARTDFREAVALEEQRHWAEAAARLRRAIAVKQTPGLHFHLGRCLDELNTPRAALAELERAAQLVAEGAPASDVASLLPAAIERARGRVPSLRITVDPSGASVEVDGAAFAPGAAQALEVGHHVVVARAAGYADARREIDLAPSQHAVIDLPLRPVARAASATPTPRPTPAPRTEAPASRASDPTRTVVLASEVSFTALALGAGILFTLSASSAESRADAARGSIDGAPDAGPGACGRASFSGRADCADLASALDDQADARRYATLGFVGAGVGALATLGTWWLWPSSKDAAATARVSPHGDVLLSLSHAF